MNNYKKENGKIIPLQKKEEKIKIGHSYIHTRTQGIIIASDTDWDTTQWKHWDECSLCKAKENRK